MPEIIYEKKEHVAQIKLNRPESLNAINRSLADELIKVWIDFRDDKNLWVAILSGEGKSFCAGADLKEMKRGKWEFRESLLFGDEPIGPSNYKVWKPIIAATQGHVNGAGLWLALESDLRISADNAMFGTREARANVPALVAPFMADFFPRAIASEMLFAAKAIDAPRAYQLGLVNKVIPAAELMAEATKMAEDICNCGPLSVWASKDLSIRTRYMDHESALALVEHIATPVWNSEDSIEAKNAFLEKRRPEWKLR
jgi:enoyl-CoA hydratase/carnithine racemase